MHNENVERNRRAANLIDLSSPEPEGRGGGQYEEDLSTLVMNNDGNRDDENRDDENGDDENEDMDAAQALMELGFGGC